MNIRYFLLPLAVAITVSIICTDRIYEMHTGKDKTEFSRLIYYPAPLVSSLALEFHGILADYLMLNSMVWHGEKILQRAEVSSEEWEMTYRQIKLITELDPRFFDPYLLAETSLPWEAGMVEETNQLLLRAAKFLPDNYRPYFFLWFNNYYFLQDIKAAAKYLEKSAIIPGAPRHYQTLAARMYLQSGDTISGIVFLTDMLRETGDHGARVVLQMRLDALNRIAFLEKNVLEYIRQYNKRPETLSDLVSRGFIKEIPDDPYGGKFYIMDNGRVYSTSKLTASKQAHQVQ